MNRMGLLAMIFIMGTVFCFGDDFRERIDSMKKNFDLQALNGEYEQLKNSGKNESRDLYRMGKVLSYTVTVQDSLNGESLKTAEMAAMAAEYSKKSVKEAGLEKEEMADAYYIVAQMYDRLIRDASSWMQYNEDKSKYLKLCLTENPDHIGGNMIQTMTFINMPENAGGNPVKGREMLNRLLEKYPDNQEILMAVANDFQNRKEMDKAEEMLNRVLRGNPAHLPAKWMLDEILLVKRSLTINSIRISGNPKTDKNRLQKKIDSFAGQKYSFEVKEGIVSKLTEIRSVSGCGINAKPLDGDKVDLEINVNENNMIMLGVLAGVNLSLDYNNNIQPNPIPALIYMDQNFLGTADNMMLIFSGPYINATLTIPGLIDDKYIDGSIHWDSMFIENGFVQYKDGKPLNDTYIKSANHAFSLGLSKTFPFGLYAGLNMRMKYNDWTTDTNISSNDLVLPAEHWTYNPNACLSFSTVGGGMGSKFDLLDGFKLETGYELVYKPEYKAWGRKNSLFGHNADPEWKTSVTAGYYKKIFDQQNIRFDVSYMTGGNMYSNEMWSAGNGSVMSSGPSLDGFYGGEFSFNTGAIGNITYQINFIPSKFATYVKYDVFYNMDDSKVYHGSAIGMAYMLPFDIQFTAQTGIGINAKRARGMGYQFDFSAMKMWFF